MESDFGGTAQVTDLLDEEIVPAPAVTRLRRRFERPKAVQAKPAVGDEQPTWPILLDAAMLLIAFATTRLFSLAID